MWLKLEGYNEGSGTFKYQDEFDKCVRVCEHDNCRILMFDKLVCSEALV